MSKPKKTARELVEMIQGELPRNADYSSIGIIKHTNGGWLEIITSPDDSVAVINIDVHRIANQLREQYDLADD